MINNDTSEQAENNRKNKEQRTNNKEQRTKNKEQITKNKDQRTKNTHPGNPALCPLVSEKRDNNSYQYNSI